MFSLMTAFYLGPVVFQLVEILPRHTTVSGRVLNNFTVHISLHKQFFLKRTYSSIICTGCNTSTRGLLLETFVPKERSFSTDAMVSRYTSACRVKPGLVANCSRPHRSEYSTHIGQTSTVTDLHRVRFTFRLTLTSSYTISVKSL